MKKLRHSKAAKTVAFLLLAVLLLSIAGNSVLLIYLINSDLYSNNREALERSVYNYISRETAQDAYEYLTYYLQSENSDYWSNKAAISKSALSQENSNAAFEIKDDTGSVVLKSFDMPDYAYKFQYSYYYSLQLRDTTTAYNNENAESSYDTTAVSTVTVEATDEANSDDSSVLTEEEAITEPVMSEYAAEPTTAFGNDNNEESALNSYHTYQPYVDINDTQLNITYYYSGDALNTEILSYCISLASDVFENYNISDFSFYENNYYVDYSGNVYKNDIDASSSTTVDKYYTITVFIPEDIGAATDIYFYANRFIDFLDGYKHQIITMLIISGVLSIVLFVFLLWSAGYVPNEEKAKAGGAHRIPFDLYMIIVITVFSSLMAIGSEFYYENTIAFFLFAVLVSFCALLVIAFLMSFAVRMRAHTIIKNNCFMYLFHWVKNSIVKKSVSLCRFAVNNTKLAWKGAAVFMSATILELIAILCTWNDPNVLLLLFALLKLIELPLVFILIANLHILQEGAKNISGGNTSYRIDNKLLLGEFKRCAGYLNDINNGINKAVNERMKSESMKTELITNVSHDLKTPLTSIVNYVDLLKKTNISDPKALEYIEVIDRQSQRLKKLTIDVLEASKAATGNIEVHNEKTMLNVLLSQINGEYLDRLSANNLTLVDEIPQEEISIMADGRLLSRVFDNLLGNICKYSQPSTRVYLSLRREENTAEIIFRNISAKELNVSPEELTERFVRGDSSRNTEGSGLGLSIARSLTEIMGGKLKIMIDGDLFKVILSFGITN